MSQPMRSAHEAVGMRSIDHAIRLTESIREGLGCTTLSEKRVARPPLRVSKGKGRSLPGTSSFFR